MFETLLKYPRVLGRHREDPAADARERLLIHRANELAARNTLPRTANKLRLVAKYIDVTTGEAVCTHALQVFAGRWVHHQQCRRRVQSPRWSRTLFLQIAKTAKCHQLRKFG
jgi:hypothetical protein